MSAITTTMIMVPASKALMELLFEVVEEEAVDVETVAAAVELEELTWLDEELELEVELVLEEEFEVEFEPDPEIVPGERFKLGEELEAVVD